MIKLEPGTGMTLLAFVVAKSLIKPIYTCQLKSITNAQQGLYEYDAVSRLRDSQLGEENVHDVANYIKKGKIWESFASDKQAV